MALQENAPTGDVRKRNKGMSGLQERLGGEGKIQWETSKETKRSAKDNYREDPHWLIQLLVVVIVAVIAELTLERGTSALIIGVVLAGLYAVRAKPHDNVPVGLGYYPYIGHIMNVFTRWHDFLDLELENYIKMGPKQHFAACLPLQRNFIFIADPETVDICYRKQFADCWKGPEFYVNMLPILGRGIIASDGKVWKRHRKVASRMFTLSSLRDYMFEVFNSTTDTLMDKMLTIHDQQGHVDLYDMYNRLTLEAFTEVAFGVKLGVIEAAPKEIQFATSFDRGVAICMSRYFDSSWRIQKLFNFGNEKELIFHERTINDMVWDLVGKCKERMANEKKQGAAGTAKLAKKCDLLSLFIADDPKITDNELRDITINFVIAGRDTTAQLLSWFSYLITQWPEVEKKVLAEIKEVFPEAFEADRCTGALDYGKISKLEYLENAFLETLRLHPSVPHLVREAKVDIHLPDGHIIRKGDGVIVPTYAMGRLPWLWDKPNEMNPDRFKGGSYTPSEYPAFNIPPRLCLGKHVSLMEAKIQIVKLLPKFKFEPLPNQTVTYEMSATNQMKHGFKVKLVPRQNE